MKGFLARRLPRRSVRLPPPPAWLVEALARRLERHAAYLPLALHMHLYKRLVGTAASAGRTDGTPPRPGPGDGG